MTGVWAFSESAAVAGEAASAAAEVARALSKDCWSVDFEAERQSYRSSGGRLIVKGAFPQMIGPEAMAESLYRAADKLKPDVILVGGTRDGKEVASRLSVKLGWACLPDGPRVYAEGERLCVERGEYAGKVLTKLSAQAPCVALVKPGAYPVVSAVEQKAAQEVEVGEVSCRSKTVSVNRKEAAKVDLRGARVIVSAGRGVKKKEDLAIIESLAKALGGTMGCSRPLSSDLGWLPEEYHIGLTGINVKPELYLAVGISGQLQHVAGIKDSKVIAAINTDKDAPIFQASDYGIVGDLYQLVPALQKAIAARRS